MRFILVRIYRKWKKVNKKSIYIFLCSVYLVITFCAIHWRNQGLIQKVSCSKSEQFSIAVVFCRAAGNFQLDWKQQL